MIVIRFNFFIIAKIYLIVNFHLITNFSLNMELFVVPNYFLHFPLVMFLSGKQKKIITLEKKQKKNC